MPLPFTFVAVHSGESTKHRMVVRMINWLFLNKPKERSNLWVFSPIHMEHRQPEACRAIHEPCRILFCFHSLEKRNSHFTFFSVKYYIVRLRDAGLSDFHFVDVIK